MLDVIQQVHSQQLHVQDNEGKWCILRIVPYRTMDNRIDGVVLSVMNEVESFSGGPRETDGMGPRNASAGKSKGHGKAAAGSRRK
jgi:hypothetical protein